VPGKPVAIAFPAGSANMPASSLAPIKQLARERGTGSISVTGFGEATSSDGPAQSAALPLALDRARAVAANLQINGVPAASISIAAEPQGSGAAATVIR
jgi:outer membrane protein OmpA-like peptidoglycan-associated protein